MRDLIDAPDLEAFADNEGSTFTVRSADDAELVLDGVDTTHNTRDDWTQYTLFFRGPSEEQFGSGIHRVDHPRLDAFDMDLRPVQTLNPDADAMHYQASFTRYVPNREPSRPDQNGSEVASRRGFLGKLAAGLGGAGLLGALFGTNEAQATSAPTRSMASQSESMIGSIAMVGFNFAPQGWAFCDGQIIPINQNTALFSLLGTTYGGDGRTTFGLPDLRGRMPMHSGNGPGLTPRSLGQKGGVETTTLTVQEMPSHSHQLTNDVTTDLHLPVSSSEADATTPEGNVLGVQPSARGTVPLYSTGSGDKSMSVEGQTSVDGTIESTGGGRSHGNVPPFQVVNFIIALNGIYPSRS